MRPLALMTLLAAGCGQPIPSAESAASLSCPSNGSKHYALIYSDSTSVWDTIIASKPAFVVLGDHKDNTDGSPPAYFHKADPSIRVLTYIPMNYGHSHGDDWLSSCSKDYTLHHSCDNSPMDWDCTSINIATRINNAMKSGYDGIFFDETPNDGGMMDYVHACAGMVKAAGADKLVIMNPGAPPPAAMFDSNTDIVCVEHDYNTTNYANINSSPWRWMAVEDGISDVGTAESHFNSFVQNGGYWYDASPSYGSLPSWYTSLASYCDLHAPGAACTGTNPPPTNPPPSNPPPPSTTSLTVHSYDLDHGNAEVNGLYTVVTDSSGKQTTGFTPLSLTLAAGSYSVDCQDYPPYTFNHWSDGSTARPHATAVSGATTLGAYYHSTSTVVVHTYDLDNGNAEVPGLWTTVTDKTGKVTTGFSPLSVSVPSGTVQVTAANYPPYTFAYWGNSSAAQPLSLSVSGSASVQAFYHSKTILTVRAYDLDHGNVEISGLFTVVTDAAGAQHTGFSPLSLTLPAGATSVNLQNYPPYTFNHWDNGTTANPRSITLSGSVTVGGYYHSN